MFIPMLKRVFGQKTSSKPVRKPGSFVPRLEALDQRILPAVFRDVRVPSLLHVTGTANADRIQITDNGAGTISVIDNGRSNTLRGISRISVETFDGPDTVEYDLNGTSSVPGTQFVAMVENVVVRLGAGDDVFHASLNSFGPLARLNLEVQGDAGNDRLSVDTSNPFAIRAGAILDVKLDGDNPLTPSMAQNVNDTLRFNYSGRIDGTLLLDLNGNVGDDNITAFVGATGSGQIGTSTTPARVRGGLGADTLDYEILTDIGFSTTAQLEGGDGFDTARCTVSSVQVASDVEQVTVILVGNVGSG